MFIKGINSQTKEINFFKNYSFMWHKSRLVERISRTTYGVEKNGFMSTVVPGPVLDEVV